MKKLLTLLIVLFFLFTANSFAQFSYQDVNSQPVHKDIRDIATDNAGNIIISGGLNTSLTFGSSTLTNNYPRSGYPGDGEYAATSFIAKQVPDGNGGYSFVWAKSIVLATHNKWDYQAVIQDMTTDASGNIYITGYFWGIVKFDAISLSYTDKIGWAIFTAKLSPGGNFVWAKMESDLISMLGHGVSVDASNNVYITGKDISKKITVNHIDKYLKNVYVAKYNSAGTKVWEKKFTSNLSNGEYYHDGQDIVANGSNIYVTGNINGAISFGNGYTFNSSGIDNSFLLNLDANGNTQWVKTVTGSPNIGQKLLVNNGDVFLKGYSNLNCNNCSGNMSFGNSVNLAYGNGCNFLVKYSSGAATWAVNTFSSSETNIIKNPTGGIVFAGAHSNSIEIKEFSPVDGTLISSTISPNPTGSCRGIWGITATPDGYIFSENLNGYFDFGGITISTTQPANNSYTSFKDMILVKYTSSPPPAYTIPKDVNEKTLYSTTTPPEAAISIHGDEKTLLPPRILLYPNPAVNQITILSNNNEQLGNIIIYDASGKSVLKAFVDNSQGTIYVQQMNPGVYFLRSDQLQTAIKFLKQ